MKISYKAHENHFRIKYKNVISVYYLNQVKDLSVLKRRDLRLNITLMFSAILCFVIAIFISEIFEPVRILSFLSSGFFSIFSLIHRAHDFDLILELQDNRTVKLKIDGLELDDIKQNVRKINKAMSKVEENSSFVGNELMAVSALKQKSID
jgi:hypothetical protein